MSSGYFASWSGPKLDDEIPYYHYNVGKKPGNFNIAKTQKNVTDMVFVNEDKTTVKTDAFNLPIGKGAIIVTLDASKENIPVTLGDEESFQGIYTAEANKGESFIIKDDKITDLNESGTNPRSLLVKAITTKTGNTSKIDSKPDPVVSSNTKLSKIVLGKHDVSNWLEDDQIS